ncbi:MAG: hypothetical protein OXI30_13130 [Chloroflexota bacterium]|nr:hypothetical protein [Chloroflexota bacterium]
MAQERQARQDYFQTLLRTVVGQAFDAAGYEFEKAPLQWAGGKYRYAKALPNGFFGLIDFQVLVASDTMWSVGAASRFTVQLTRSHDRHGQARAEAGYVTRGLSQLVVEDFSVAILPAADHWWTFADTESLGKALAEAGHLIVGYGMPWLAGELTPPPRKNAGDLA